MRKVLRIHPDDDLMVALRNLSRGEHIHEDGVSLELRDPVPAKQKFAIRHIPAGGVVRMYGVLVGRAVDDLSAGERLTPSRIRHDSESFHYRAEHRAWSPPEVAALSEQTFDGYWRDDGKVGTANHWLVVPLVFCENRNLDYLKQALVKELGYSTAQAYQRHVRELIELYRSGKGPQELLAWEPGQQGGSGTRQRLFPNVDGVKFLAHSLGCGETNEDSRELCGLLAGYITHPNVAGVTVLSLGCQKAQRAMIEEEIHRRCPEFSKPFLFFEQQRSRSERDMLTEAVKQTFVGLIGANELRRRPAGLDRLVVGMECGGSDGFSGISANPAMGYTSDLIVALGGAVILAEFPELCGVEQDLIDRCVNQEVAQRFIELMTGYEAQARAVGSNFDVNRSPGNEREGLLTGAMKSAGAARKGGTSPVTDALDYPEWVTQPGLNLLCTPGGDVQSTTAMAGAGANLLIFSTGLGTPTGNAVAPVIKVSSNTSLARRLPDIIDFDAGRIVGGDQAIEQAGRDLLNLCVEVAGGQVTPKAVELGQDDFIPWKRGVSL